MKLVLAIAALAATAMAMPASHRAAFNAWKSQFGRTYGTPQEEALRFAIFRANAQKVAAHNAAGHTWSMALNEFADLTGEEFRSRYVGGYKRRNLRRTPAPSVAKPLEALPASVDWVAAGAVTPIKNQGQCGSCWAFSTTGSVEGITFISTKQLISLSEQQLVDCSGAEGNQGCNGGLMDYAFQYIIKNNGICSEASYPYTGTDGQCKSSSCQSVATITGYTDVTPDSDTDLMTAIVQQPVSIAVEADQNSFQFYSGGVLTAKCGVNLDHGVLAVGYGTLSGTDYYKVKNSWGASWGMQGYILLGRGTTYNGGKGECGILQMPSYPTK